MAQAVIEGKEGEIQEEILPEVSEEEFVETESVETVEAE